MTVYIASSWKNQHGVEMLTKLIRDMNINVVSWVENNYGENHNHVTQKFSFEEWVQTPDAVQSFMFDTDGAKHSDLVIYYAPAGKDACAELGVAWAFGVPIYGLYAKGEDLGLMRLMVKKWFSRYEELLQAIDEFKQMQLKYCNPFAVFGNQRPHPMDFEDREEYNERIRKYIEWEIEHSGPLFPSNQSK